MLRDITLNYTTAEEKRFLANVDFNSVRHVESALPFYVSKIKQITLYVSRQRDLIKQQKVMSSHAGSVYGLTRELTTNVLNRVLDPTKFNVSDGFLDDLVFSVQTFIFNRLNIFQCRSLGQFRQLDIVLSC